jgi:glycerophosphoryl diester phosphodiesterase
MLPIPAPPGFSVIAHRGASAYAPENTEAAFALAAQMGISAVELDTQLTTDGHVVLCHDDTLERYGHGPRRVESLTVAELTALDMGAWFSPFLYGGEHLLTLDALFQRFENRFTYHVEIKGTAPGLVQAVAAQVSAHRLTERAVITSFRHDALAEMHTLAPGLPLAWLVDHTDEATLTQARHFPLFQLCPKAEHITPAGVQAARSVAPQVRAWGLTGARPQTIQRIHQVITAGCDGMTLDWPDWVVPQGVGIGE